MRPLRQAPRRGFTLIELLVTLVIGMIAVIVMLQILSAAEGRKRTTTGGDSAQTSGALALYELQRGLRQAGHGWNTAPVIGCDLTLRAGVTVPNLGPAVINPNITNIANGRDPNTDTLLVFYGSSEDSPEGDKIEVKPTANSYTLAGFTAASAPSFSAGDRVVAQAATRPAPCALALDTTTGVSVQTVSVTTGAAGTVGGNLFNLGPNPTVLVYRVKDGRLTLCDYMVNDCGAAYNSAHWVPIAGNIVSLRADYGRDTVPTNMDGAVDVYDRSTPTTQCGWLRTRAVRVALVARSAQLEKDTVPASAPSWVGQASTPIDLSNDSAWQRYRYKTFETTVPLRNLSWVNSTDTGC